MCLTTFEGHIALSHPCQTQVATAMPFFQGSPSTLTLFNVKPTFMAAVEDHQVF